MFDVKEGSAREAVGGEPLYFCCAACAAYFAQNRERVLALRSLAARAP